MYIVIDSVNKNLTPRLTVKVTVFKTELDRSVRLESDHSSYLISKIDPFTL